MSRIWAFIKRAGRWIAERLKDLLYNPGNRKLDNGRVAVFLAFGMMIGAVAQNVRIGAAIDVGPAGLGGGLAAVLAAAEFYLFKDRAQRGGQ